MGERGKGERETKNGKERRKKRKTLLVQKGKEEKGVS